MIFTIKIIKFEFPNCKISNCHCSNFGRIEFFFFNYGIKEFFSEWCLEIFFRSFFFDQKETNGDRKFYYVLLYVEKISYSNISFYVFWYCWLLILWLPCNLDKFSCFKIKTTRISRYFAVKFHRKNFLQHISFTANNFIDEDINYVLNCYTNFSIMKFLSTVVIIFSWEYSNRTLYFKHYIIFFI